MDLTIGVAAAAATLASAVFVWLQVREMKHQTKLQREIAESAGQPYVWADVRIQESNGWILQFVVGNSGPTVATNVRVRVDPPFPDVMPDKITMATIHEKLTRGLSSLAPGRELAWPIGKSPDLVNRDGELAHTITIDCDGPYGSVTTSEYVISFADMRESIAKHPGSLNEVKKAIERAAQELSGARKPIQVQLISLDEE